MNNLEMNHQNNKSNERVVKNLAIRLSDYIEKILILAIILSILVFILYPVISVISTSFIGEGKISLEEYKTLFNPINIQLIKNSVWTSTLSSISSIIIASIIAIYIVFSNNKDIKFINYSLVLTMISPPFVGSLAFIVLFGRRGIITHDLLGLSINPYGWQGIVLMQSIGEISFASLMLVGIFKNIDNRLISASRDLGASSFETIKRVILPLATPGILATLFIIFTKNLADFGTPIIIGGNFNVLATEAYLTAIGRANLPKAAAMSVVLIIPAIIAFYFYRKSMKKIGSLSGGTKSSTSKHIDFNISKPVKLILGIITWAFIAIILIQYITIFISAISNRASGSLTFTLDYIKTFKLTNLDSFMRSIKYSLVAGFLASSIGILLSYYVERRNIYGMRFIEFIASLPYIIPGTFFGIGYILAFNKKPLLLIGTVAIVVLNCTFRQISVGSKGASALFSNIDKQIEKAATDLGAPKLMIIKDIIIPLLKPAFLSSFINTFTSTMTTVGAIIFLISPGANVATVEMFNAIKNGNYGVGSVIACLIIIITFTVNILAIKTIDN
ncbi:ABC transporter permease [Paraclostridium benzoelyticum]|nr:iron ABC transporter permease [Paraclostridium benzoelyticum]